jgi:hypothetical protein
MAAAVLIVAAAGAGCDVVYPEVVLVNRTAEHVLMKNPQFNGCVWNVVLTFGQSTSPGRCLPGSDRVHFQKLDLDEQAASAAAPVWFNYQTVSVKQVRYGTFEVFEIQLDDLEQDFSVPGPFGH